MALRSALFGLLFYTITLTILIVASPVLLFGRHAEMRVVGAWSHIMMALHRLVVGIRHEYRGFDSLPTGACIVAMKHQSTWETIALVPFFRDPAFILKRELIWIPLFGWWAHRAKMIPVARGRGGVALAGMTAAAREAVREGRQIMIFPEGTRREAGAGPNYKSGIMHLYRDLQVPIVPIALNSGAVWPRRTFVQRRGTVVAEVLPPIPANLDPREAFNRLQIELESACDRLLLEADSRGDDLPPLARQRVADLRAGAGVRITPARGSGWAASV